MKKILIVITKGEVGGAQMSVFNLAKKLQSMGQQVTVAVGTGEFLPKKLAAANIPCLRLTNLGRGHNLFKNIAYINELKKYLNKNKYDAVHFNSSNALLGAIAAKLSKHKPKTVFTYRGLSILDPNYSRNKIKLLFYRLVFKILLKFIDKQVFVSCDNQKLASKLKLAKNDVVIYNGLDPKELNFLSRLEARTLLSKKIKHSLEGKTVIGSIGRLAYQKNYEFFIRHFKEIASPHKDVVGIIIGDGPKKNYYQKLISKYDLQQSIFLIDDMAEAYKVMRGFDLFVLTSRYEGMPITLIEAFFAGLPIITSNIGGNREMIENTGLLYTLKNPQDFIDKTAKLLSDKQLRAELAQKSIKKAEEHDIAKTASAYLKIF